MTAILVKTNGQNLVVHSSSATLYTTSAYSVSVTLPATISTDTTYYANPNNGNTAIVVKQLDGSTLWSNTIQLSAWNGAYTIDALPTAAQVAADLPRPSGLFRSGALAETFPRNGSSLANSSVLSTGRLHMVGINLPAGLTVTTISLCSATTALSVGANQWFALFDSTRVLLDQTADDTSTAWGANTVKTLTLADPVTTTYHGLHYVGINVTATTPPTLVGVASSSAGLGLTPILNGYSDTSLTDTAPATATAITATANVPWAYVS